MIPSLHVSAIDSPIVGPPTTVRSQTGVTMNEPPAYGTSSSAPVAATPTPPVATIVPAAVIPVAPASSPAAPLVETRIDQLVGNTTPQGPASMIPQLVKPQITPQIPDTPSPGTVQGGGAASVIAQLTTPQITPPAPSSTDGTAPTQISGSDQPRSVLPWLVSTVLPSTTPPPSPAATSQPTTPIAVATQGPITVDLGGGTSPAGSVLGQYMNQEQQSINAPSVLPKLETDVVPANVPSTTPATTTTSSAPGTGTPSLSDTLAQLLLGSGSQDPLAAVGTPTQGALESVTPVAAPSASTGNPALIVGVLAAIAAVVAIVILRHKKKTPPAAAHG